jgi:aldehyde:ferredoxin oxidoreductase
MRLKEDGTMGFTGKLLEIDLTNRSHSVVDLDKDMARRFIGGKGLGACLLYERTDKGMDPFDPANPLMFLTGPLTGTKAPTSGRWCVVTKSPLTGLYLDSHVGGYFGMELKRAGYDGIIVTGIADRPLYVSIVDDKVELLDAHGIWGLGTVDTVRHLREKYHDEKLRIASIGQAGENLVKYAMIAVDSHEQKERGGQAGRGGSGAVMGSKNLKAICVKGTGFIPYHDPEAFGEAAKEAHMKVQKSSAIITRKEYGTTSLIRPMNSFGILPTKNFSTTIFEHSEDINGEHMKEAIVTANKGCFGCPMMCGKQSYVKEGKYKGTEVEGPEYELLALMGSNCGITNVEAIAKGAYLVDDLGLDGISTGVAISFIMECYKHGVISKDDLWGMEGTFGNEELYVKLIHAISQREGIGDLLAEGVKRAAERLGQGTEEYAMHVKGMELPGYDPRGTHGMGIAYATSDRGACHQRAWTVNNEILAEPPNNHSIKGKARLVKDIQDERAACFSLVLCDFVPLDLEDFVSMTNASTGFNYTEDEYLKCGERIWNLTRLFNVREGADRKADTLPKRLTEPVPEGPSEGKAVTVEMLDSMLDEYYEYRGWTVDGIPGAEKIKELGLDS